MKVGEEVVVQEGEEVVVQEGGGAFIKMLMRAGIFTADVLVPSGNRRLVPQQRGPPGPVNQLVEARGDELAQHWRRASLAAGQREGRL